VPVEDRCHIVYFIYFCIEISLCNKDVILVSVPQQHRIQFLGPYLFLAARARPLKISRDFRRQEQAAENKLIFGGY
jgi:hypothetical protein